MAKAVGDERNNTEKEWLMSLLNPFDYVGKQPSFYPIPTTTFQAKLPLVIKTDANGRFMWAACDSVRKAKSNSWVDITGSGVYGWVYGGAGWYMPGGSGPANPSNGGLPTNWFPLDEFVSIQDIFQGYRVTGMGVEVKYIAAMTTATGEITGGLWTNVEPFPSADVQGVAKTYNDFKEDEFSHSVPAMEGIAVRGLPAGVDITKFRQMYYKNNVAFDATLTSSFDEVTSTWRIDQDTFAAFEGINAGNPVYVSTTSGSFTSGVGYALNSGANGIWSGTKIFDNWDHAPPMTFFTPYIVGSGLVADTEVLSGYVVYNFEAIVDNKTLRTAVGRTQSRSTHSGPDSTAKVAAIAHEVPAVTSNKGSRAMQVANGLKKAASAGRTLSKGKTANMIKKIADAGTEGIDATDVFDTIGEIASAALAFF